MEYCFEVLGQELPAVKRLLGVLEGIGSRMRMLETEVFARELNWKSGRDPEAEQDLYASVAAG